MARAQDLQEVPVKPVERVPTSLRELNRVLGGGLSRGRVTLLGGAPGIGKTTLLLHAVSGKTRGRLVSREEATGDLRAAARRR